MRWVLVCGVGALLLAEGQAVRAEHPAVHAPEVSLYGPTFKVGWLKFTVPSRWQTEPVENENRAGQWRVPPPHGEDGESGEVVVFFFGPGVGGTARENVEAWMSTVLTPDGQPAPAKVNNHVESGIKISQVTLFGTYTQASSVPGLPPQVKPKYGLLGAVIENPQGNIYWRFTGPEALITANAALFDKIVSTVKPQDK